MIGEYAAGSLVEVPLECPWRDAEAPCDVVQHALRARKTGPDHALVVCRCHAHGAWFSVYPEGFVPYARRPLRDVLSSQSPSYEAAAREAAAGDAWPRLSDGERSWSTQRRLIRRLSEAFGAFDVAARDVVGIALGLPLRLLSHLAGAVGYRARGRASAAVLDVVSDDLDRVLLAGALTGAWGHPWRWHRGPPRLACLVPAHLGDSAILSTNLKHGFPPPFS